MDHESIRCMLWARFHSFYVVDHEPSPPMLQIPNPLFHGHTLGVGENIFRGKVFEKSLNHKKAWRMGPPGKKKLKGQGKARFFCGTTIHQDFPDSSFFPMKSSKTETAAKSEEKNRMLRVTMLCLVCFRERTHPCNVIFVMDPSPRLPHVRG